MILTLTLNPAVDHTLWVDTLHQGAVNRPAAAHLDPAGKGVNVSRMAHRLGRPTMALGFLAGDLGRLVENALSVEGVQHHFLTIPGQTRINVTIVGARGEATSLFCPGPTAPPEALRALDELVDCWLSAGRVLVLAGSLLPGVPDDTYARYLRLAAARGVRTILDADGVAQRTGVAARPYLIKPNVEEAARLLGRPLPDEAAVIAAARELQAGGVPVVVISRGADGAICVGPDGAWRVIPPEVERLSTVGSGDSLVAGLAVELARGGSLLDGLRLGAAAGAATAMSSGTALGTAADVQRLLSQVRITPLV